MTVTVPSIADMAETAVVPTVRSIADYIRETLIPQINDSDVTAIAMSVSGSVLTVTLTTAAGDITGNVTLPSSGEGGGEAEITEVSGEVTDGQLYITVNGETSAGIQLPTSEGGGVSSVEVEITADALLRVTVDGVTGEDALPPAQLQRGDELTETTFPNNPNANALFTTLGALSGTSVPIVVSVAGRVEDGQLIITVNGVDSDPVDLSGLTGGD